MQPRHGRVSDFSEPAGGIWAVILAGVDPLPGDRGLRVFEPLDEFGKFCGAVFTSRPDLDVLEVKF